jgi:hypothetical protein
MTAPDAIIIREEVTAVVIWRLERWVQCTDSGIL